MIKKLAKHCNSLALILDKPVLELLKIDADIPLEISTDGQKLIVSPVRDEHRQKKFQEALLSANREIRPHAQAPGRMMHEPLFSCMREAGHIRFVIAVSVK